MRPRARPGIEWRSLLRGLVRRWRGLRAVKEVPRDATSGARVLELPTRRFRGYFSDAA